MHGVSARYLGRSRSGCCRVGLLLSWGAQRDGDVMADSEGRALAWTVLAPVLAAAVPALLGAVGLWFREWRNHRNDSVRQRRAVESAHLYVRYLSDWFVAY